MMRNATPLKPRERARRPTAEIGRWKRRREAWVAALEPASLFHRLFDHLPGVHFFAKDKDGRLMFASRGLLDRYHMRNDSDFIGRTDFDLNPDTMAQAYVDDDQRILAGKTRLIERIELWWDQQGMPDWFLVTKLPLTDKRGRIQGVMGTLRRPDEEERRLPVFQTVAQATDSSIGLTPPPRPGPRGRNPRENGGWRSAPAPVSARRARRASRRS